MSFREKWLEAVEKKNSILCAGLDPAEFAMGRTEKGEGLPENVNKREWAIRYVEAVAPYCAAVKPNMQYWKKEAGDNPDNKSDLDTLVEIVQLAHAKGLVVIDDSKLADIGSTNDAGVYYSQDKKYDAVTFSPFAGNMQEAAEQAHARGIGLISMCLMSNKQYEREKNKLVDVKDEVVNGEYIMTDIINVEGVPHVKQYIQLAHNAKKFGVGGIVVGAPSPKNHIKDEEIRTVADYYFCLGREGLILVPGIGAQGGEVTSLSKYFNADNLICNVGRGLMFPNESYSTQEQQAEAAKTYRDMLNSLRTQLNS